MKPRILVVCDYYLPGYKAGGGMWAVRNMVERFSDRYDFFIVTKNHDGRRDRTPYTTVKTNEWNRVENAEVHYLFPRDITARKIASLANEIKPDAIFLNSVFSTPVIKYLLARRLGVIKDIPTIEAVCGELSPAMLRLKRFKKSTYLALAKLTGLYRGLIWRASSKAECGEIRTVFGEEPEIHVAVDLPPKTMLPDFDHRNKPEKRAGGLKIIFVSRIARKKNLSYVLSVLEKPFDGEIELEIVGNPEDVDYWSECKAIMERLPSNVSVSVTGSVTHAEAMEKLLGSHLFVLPTMGENFGYVCLEALVAGCPILISDQTIWNDIEDKNAGWTPPLSEPGRWNDTVKYMIELDGPGFRELSENARKYALEWLARPETEEATRRLLEIAVSRNK